LLYLLCVFPDEVNVKHCLNNITLPAPTTRPPFLIKGRVCPLLTKPACRRGREGRRGGLLLIIFSFLTTNKPFRQLIKIPPFYAFAYKDGQKTTFKELLFFDILIFLLTYSSTPLFRYFPLSFQTHVK
jgi:hypothetical protein